MFALKREQAACQRPDLDPYDALLDDYEPGGRWKTVAEQFTRLRSEIVPLVQGCGDASRRPSDAILRRHYPLRDQERFVRAVAERIGFDFDRGRLDTTDHPFCSTLGPDDCRITTRWDESYLPTALFGVLHEAGHGLYEQGLPREWFGLPPGEAASLGIHESQSRLWENLVGRSPEFWEWCFPMAREAFANALGDTSAADVQQSLLVVEPSFIRVEADEVTYNLHVMLRFDLERAVVHGDLPVADLPAAWNERFENDFGRRPPNDAEGVLQDIHWSAGLIGYFPTYTLGNIFAAQLMKAATQAIPGLDRQMAAGEFGELLGVAATQRACDREDVGIGALGGAGDGRTGIGAVARRESFSPLWAGLWAAVSGLCGLSSGTWQRAKSRWYDSGSAKTWLLWRSVLWQTRTNKKSPTRGRGSRQRAKASRRKSLPFPSTALLPTVVPMMQPMMPRKPAMSQRP